MKNPQDTIQMTPCESRLPELERCVATIDRQEVTPGGGNGVSSRLEIVTSAKTGRISKHMKKRVPIRLLPSRSKRVLGLRQLLAETRVFGEWMLFTLDRFLHPSLAVKSPATRGVLLIPGFGAGDLSLTSLAMRLRELGHLTFASGIWCNLDCPAHTMPRLEKVLRKANLKTGAKVIIIGHSLGGLYARQLACLFPDLVERVILLGSPVKSPLDGSNALLKPIFEFWHDRCADSLGSSDSGERKISPNPPSVPETLIYSRTDGIVNWQNCIETGPNVEALEVPSSHCGLPFSPKALQIIEDRVARRSEERLVRPLKVAGSELRHPLNRVPASLTSDSKPELTGNDTFRHPTRSRGAIGWSAALRSPLSVRDLEDMNFSRHHCGEGDAHTAPQE